MSGTTAGVGRGSVVGIEVKSGRSPAVARGLVEFQRRFPGAGGVVVGERGVPLGEFLSLPSDHWLEAAER